VSALAVCLNTRANLTRSREGWQCDEANAKRGFEWQNRLYQQDQGAIDNVLASQRDFGELSIVFSRH
jgi:hypothetical protein